jgi:hypothetical protein
VGSSGRGWVKDRGEELRVWLRYLLKLSWARWCKVLSVVGRLVCDVEARFELLRPDQQFSGTKAWRHFNSAYESNSIFFEDTKTFYLTLTHAFYLHKSEAVKAIEAPN